MSRMVSWPEHANFMHGEPHEDDLLLDSSRKGNLISGPCLLHLDGGQCLKKSLSSHATAKLVPWLMRDTRRAAKRNPLIFLYCNRDASGDEDEGKQGGTGRKGSSTYFIAFFVAKLICPA